MLCPNRVARDEPFAPVNFAAPRTCIVVRSSGSSLDSVSSNTAMRSWRAVQKTSLACSTQWDCPYPFC